MPLKFDEPIGHSHTVVVTLAKKKKYYRHLHGCGDCMYRMIQKD
jgi:hypothetical protein